MVVIGIFVFLSLVASEGYRVELIFVEVLTRLHYTLALGKCSFFHRRVNFLGFLVEGVQAEFKVGGGGYCTYS